VLFASSGMVASVCALLVSTAAIIKPLLSSTERDRRETCESFFVASLFVGIVAERSNVTSHRSQ